mmetsp:Transcript_24014/g.49323  ORF Transcript_24014/g.49323 Transcript_24014/m.49323 type:complete len:91 (+) Transcript_24014:593-865(+)
MKCSEAWTKVAGITSTETLQDWRGTCQPTGDPSKPHSCNHTQGGHCLQIVLWPCRSDDEADSANERKAADSTDVSLVSHAGQHWHVEHSY